MRVAASKVVFVRPDGIASEVPKAPTALYLAPDGSLLHFGNPARVAHANFANGEAGAVA